MIKKLEKMLTPRTFLDSDVTITAEEAANIFGVLLSVANLLDSQAVKSKGDLADCLSKGMERMILSTEDLANVQKAWGKLV